MTIFRITKRVHSVLAKMARARQSRTSTERPRENAPMADHACHQFHTWTCQPSRRTRQFTIIPGTGQQRLVTIPAQLNTASSGVRSSHRIPQTQSFQPVPHPALLPRWAVVKVSPHPPSHHLVLVSANAPHRQQVPTESTDTRETTSFSSIACELHLVFRVGKLLSQR